MEEKTKTQSTESEAYLVQLTGLGSEKRHPVLGPVVRIGRGEESDLIPEQTNLSTISKQHLEIYKSGDSYRIRDLDSTNGTYLNGRRIQEEALEHGAVFMLVPDGPQFQFRYLDRPVESDPELAPATGPKTRISRPPAADQDRNELMEEALRKSREARKAGGEGHTGFFMREVVSTSVKRSRKPLFMIIGGMALLLLIVSAYAYWTIDGLKRKKFDLDQHIAGLETRLQDGGDPEEVELLIKELEKHQEAAKKVQRSLMYKLGVRSEELDFIETEIRALMSEFGAENYSIPPEFSEQVRRYVNRYQEQDRKNIERTLNRHWDTLQQVRQSLESDSLPPDLAYIVVVESAFVTNSSSSAGAVGLWQLLPGTARAYGLTVTDEVDERLDVKKSTQAAGKYLRELIIQFGSGSSVMLALAAYNLGPTRIRRTIRKVEDPIRQRNFWYLYRSRALPAETRGYIPKIFAAVIICRNPEQLGFRVGTTCRRPLAVKGSFGTWQPRTEREAT